MAGSSPSGADDSPSWSERRTRGFSPRSWEHHGWLLFALPLLLIISGLALLRIDEPVHRAPAEVHLVRQPPPAAPFPPSTFTADLPPGGEVPATGTGRFAVLPGTSPVVGHGRVMHYTVEVEDGVQLPEGNDTFGAAVQDTLSDPRSWTNPAAATRRGPVALQRIDRGRPDFRVTLVSQGTARKACGFQVGLPFDTSCEVGDREFVNAARWVRGAVAFEGDLGTYRHYVINHEVGHVLGLKHVACPAPGALAPTMMQQTFSTSNDVLHDLNEQDSQGSPIPRDGATCKPSAWPFPTG